MLNTLCASRWLPLRIGGKTFPVEQQTKLRQHTHLLPRLLLLLQLEFSREYLLSAFWFCKAALASLAATSVFCRRFCGATISNVATHSTRNFFDRFSLSQVVVFGYLAGASFGGRSLAALLAQSQLLCLPESGRLIRVRCFASRLRLPRAAADSNLVAPRLWRLRVVRAQTRAACSCARLGGVSCGFSGVVLLQAPRLVATLRKPQMRVRQRESK